MRWFDDIKRFSGLKWMQTPQERNRWSFLGEVYQTLTTLGANRIEEKIRIIIYRISR